jgi:hypothetical protein
MQQLALVTESKKYTSAMYGRQSMRSCFQFPEANHLLQKSNGNKSEEKDFITFLSAWCCGAHRHNTAYIYSK